jgi:hypothetical protein
VSGLRTYDLAEVDQLRVAPDADLIPQDPDARNVHLRMLAIDATIYGLASVYQYAQLYEQAVDTSSESFTGFNRFLHQRRLATPAFGAFKTPNVDTLYSNAWLDLTSGPVVVEVPPIAQRYYTLQFVDMYGNASNLSSRTVGDRGGRFLVTTTNWEGEVPAGTRRFRVATPFMWILMRILVKGPTRDVETVCSLQDDVTITPPPGGDVHRPQFIAVTFDEVQRAWVPFFRALDWTLRHNGHPTQEDDLVQRFRSLGLGVIAPFDEDTVEPTTRTALQAGFQDAMTIIASSAGQVGERGPTGWSTGTAGENGYAHLRRAVQNYVGTGGNVAAEKKFFVTFEGGDRCALDGSRDCYSVRFPVLPPVDGHWSLTVYPSSTGLLYPNAIDRYAIAATTPGLTFDSDGALTIILQQDRPESDVNWLPVPAEPFYVDLRLWEPRPEVRDGRWIPPRVETAASSIP